VLFDHVTVQSKAKAEVVSTVVVEVPLFIAKNKGARLFPTPYSNPPIIITDPLAPVVRQVIIPSPEKPKLVEVATNALAVHEAKVEPPSFILTKIFPTLRVGVE
jgi:hypothetical protein